MNRLVDIGFLASILILKVSGQCPEADIVFSSPTWTYSGHVLVDNETFFLVGDQGGVEGGDGEHGIHVEAGCKNAGATDDVTLTILGETNDYFVINDAKKIQKKVIMLSSTLSTSKAFPFQNYKLRLKASNAAGEYKTAEVTVSADQVINAFAPSFNFPVFYGSLNLTECPDTPTDPCDVQVSLEKTLDATDQDSGPAEIEYILDSLTPHATQFTISAETGEIRYIGLQNSISKDVNVVLVVKAVEQRPDGRTTSVPVVIAVAAAEAETVTTTTTTVSPQLGDCEETDLERKYFISMLVLGSVLSGLLTALLLLILFCCCKRCCGGGGGGGSGRADIVQATKASMKHSGVMAEGAVFKSFKDTTYLTLQSQHSPGSARSTNDWDSSNSLPRYEPRTRYEDTDSTASAGYAARRRN